MKYYLVYKGWTAKEDECRTVKVEISRENAEKLMSRSPYVRGEGRILLVYNEATRTRVEVEWREVK